MKRIAAHIALILAVVLVLPLFGCAQHTHIVIASQSIGDFYCSMYEDETIEIIRYMGKDAVVQVPSHMNDRTVVGISTRAFVDNEYVEEVYLPSTITALPAKLFDNCVSLRAVYIPAAVKSIGSDFISDCPAFTTVMYGGSEAQWGAVSKGTVITENYSLALAEYEYDYVIDPNEKKHVLAQTRLVGDFLCAIYEDDTIEILNYSGRDDKVRVPSRINDMQVIGINSKAFSTNQYVKEVYLPSTLTELPATLFYDCARLRTVYIPASVTEIGVNFIVDCPRFTSVLYAGTEKQWQAINMGESEEDNIELLDAEIKFEFVVQD